MPTSRELQIIITLRDRASRALDGLRGKLAGVRNAIRRVGQVALPIGAAALGGLGFAALKAANDLEEAMRTIRVGTGATGEQLLQLQNDFKAVAKEVPASFSEVATAVADLNTRLGVSGERLQRLARAEIELARLTKSDLSEAINLSTRVFGDWGIAVEDAEETLNKLFRTAQSTGVDLAKLQRLIVQYGAPLRQLGFSFDEAAAILGKFDKEGVNTELVLGSLRIALGKMARDGEPAIETFQRIVDQIKNAGSTAEANRLALELFGARAGPDMAAAIREGRFEIGKYLDAIKNGRDTIVGVAEETRTWQERLAELKNNVLIALSPILEGITSQIEDHLIPAVQSFSDWVTEHQDDIEGGFRAMASGAGAVKEALVGLKDWLDQNKPALIAAVAAIGAAFAWANPLLTLFIGAGGLIFALGLFRTKVEELPEPLLRLRIFIAQEIVQPTLELIFRLLDGIRAIPGAEKILSKMGFHVADAQNALLGVMRDVNSSIEDVRRQMARMTEQELEETLRKTESWNQLSKNTRDELALQITGWDEAREKLLVWGVAARDAASILQALGKENLPLAGRLMRELGVISEDAKQAFAQLKAVGIDPVTAAVAAGLIPETAHARNAMQELINLGIDPLTAAQNLGLAPAIAKVRHQIDSSIRRYQEFLNQGVRPLSAALQSGLIPNTERAKRTFQQLISQGIDPVNAAILTRLNPRVAAAIRKLRALDSVDPTVTVRSSGLNELIQSLERALSLGHTIGATVLRYAQAIAFRRPPGRQFGGPVSAGRPFLVGELGPELFIPRVAGRIEPLGNALRPVSVSLVVNGPILGDEFEARRFANQIGRLLRRAEAF